MSKKLYIYKQEMEQVDYPDGAKSIHQVVCTEDQAEKSIGTLYKDNPSWRIISMNKLSPFET